jgi:hypothetical protein
MWGNTNIYEQNLMISQLFSIRLQYITCARNTFHLFLHISHHLDIKQCPLRGTSAQTKQSTRLGGEIPERNGTARFEILMAVP